MTSSLFTDRARCAITGEGSLLAVEFLTGAVVNTTAAVEVTLACEKILRGLPRPALVDCRQAKRIDYAAQKYFYCDGRHVLTYTAVAVLTRTTLGKHVAALLARTLRPLRPVRLFSSPSEANSWLQKMTSAGSLAQPKGVRTE